MGNFRQKNCMNKIIYQNVSSNVLDLEKGTPGSVKPVESILCLLWQGQVVALPIHIK